jgi:hypothetical protein
MTQSCAFVALFHQIPDFGTLPPQLIPTGGDPLAPADSFDSIDETRKLGISFPSLRAPPRRWLRRFSNQRLGSHRKSAGIRPNLSYVR